MQPTQVISPPSITMPQAGVQVLTPQEIAAVAGGPEGSVGTGINPP